MKNACRIMVGRCVEYYCMEGREVDKICFRETGFEYRRWLDWLRIISSGRFWQF
jgi:hypothetical protein